MFYSKYSDYSYEQIVEDSESYKYISSKFLERYGDTSDIEKMKSILFEGGFDDFTINSGRTKNNPLLEGNRRIAYAYLLANHPETFDKIQKDNVILFHGTRVDALPNILKYGMKSFAESIREGIDVTTGEQSTRMGGNREFISFTDDIGIALDYASIGGSKEQESSFGVMIGMSIDSLEQLRTCNVASDTPEIGIRDNIPVEHIKMLMVPPGKEEVVKKMVGDLPIEVMPINIEEPFYGMSRHEMKQEFEMDDQTREQQTQSKPEYTKQDMKDLAKGRKLSRILGWISKLKEKIKDRGTEDNVR